MNYRNIYNIYRSHSPDGDSGRLAQLQVESYGGSVAVHGDPLAVQSPVLSVVSLEVDHALLRALHQDRLVRRLVALQAQRALSEAHESLLRLQHQDRTVDQVEVEFTNVLHSVGRREQMARPFRGQELAVVRAERNGSIAVPDQLEQRISCTPISSRLHPTAGRETPIAVLRGAQSPAVRVPIELHLEGLIVADLVLVRGHVHALLHRHVLCVHGGHERRLRQRVLQREQFVPRDSLRARLQHRLRADRRQVQAVTVAQCQVAAVVLGTEQAVVGAAWLQLAVAVQVLVVACVQCVTAALLRAELQREQRVFAPRNIGVHMDLVLAVGQVRESLPTDGP